MELASYVHFEVWEQLRASFRARAPLWVRPSPEQCPPLRLTWSDRALESVLRLTALFNAGSFRVITQGKPVRPAAYRDRSGWVRWEAIEQLRAAGASVNLTRTEDYSNAHLAFARALEAALQSPVQINFYATPPEAQGLGAHTDPHDVLVYQLHGRKTWQVANLRIDLAGAETITLQPGDWLFVPRGTRHEVRNLHPEPTAHLAIGLHPLTWGDFWQTELAAARQTVAALDAAIEADATSALSAQKLAQELAPALAEANPALARERHLHSFRSFAVPVPAEDIMADDRLGSLHADTPLRWRHSRATIRPANEFVEVDLPYRRTPLPLRPDLEPALRFMTSAPHFAAKELPAIHAQVSLLLCRLLAAVGALEQLE